MAVTDYSGQAWFQGFNDVGQAVLGMTADELVEIKVSLPELDNSSKCSLSRRIAMTRSTTKCSKKPSGRPSTLLVGHVKIPTMYVVHAVELNSP